MAKGNGVLWALGGMAVVGGVAYWLLHKSTSSQPSQAATDAAVAADPCANANKLAALAAADPSKASDFSGPYQYWATQCRARGGTPNPFPV